MENATKALEMAGSVLIGVLILGCIVYAYSRLTEIKKEEQTSERIEQSTDFNKDYDAYNRDDLYGSDIFSVANMVKNYNVKEADTKDYGKISIEIKVKKVIRDAKYFKYATYNAETITEAYNNLATTVTRIGSKEYFNKAVSYWANFGTSTRLENQIKQETNGNYNNSKLSHLKDDIIEYQDYVSEQKDMARKTFKCTKMEYYNNTGRVKYMEFTET